MKKTSLILGILLISLIILGCTTTDNPIPTDENGIVEISYKYCSQFTEENCNEKMVPLNYNTEIDNYYPEPVRCYWNIKTSECFANIGYQ